jgi:hypothetical protein
MFHPDIFIHIHIYVYRCCSVSVEKVGGGQCAERNFKRPQMGAGCLPSFVTYGGRAPVHVFQGYFYPRSCIGTALKSLPLS